MATPQQREKERQRLIKEQLRKRLQENLTPYSGHKYQQPAWVHAVFATEKAIYEIVMLSQRRLTNDHCKAAFERLIRMLHTAEQPELLPQDNRDRYVLDLTDDLPEALAVMIRREWGFHVANYHPVAKADWIGILRTLLHSLEAHAWNTGPLKGYLHYLEGFMRGRLGMEVVVVNGPSQQAEADND